MNNTTQKYLAFYFHFLYTSESLNCLIHPPPHERTRPHHPRLL